MEKKPKTEKRQRPPIRVKIVGEEKLTDSDYARIAAFLLSLLDRSQ